MGRTKLYKSMGFEVEQPEIDYEMMWKNIENGKMKAAFDNYESSDQYEEDSDSNE